MEGDGKVKEERKSLNKAIVKGRRVKRKIQATIEKRNKAGKKYSGVEKRLRCEEATHSNNRV